MKKILALLLAVGLLLGTLPVMADTPALSDILAAQDVDDIDTIEKLLRQEKTLTGTAEGYTLTIDDNGSRPMNWDILGVQCEMPDVHANFQVKGSTELAEGYLKIADDVNNMTIARWGGGHSDGLNLMHNIGPLEERKPSYDLRVDGDGVIAPGLDWGYRRKSPSAIGPVEFIKAMQAVNPDIKFIICLPIFTQTPEQSNQLVHFLLDEKDESEWGALRASYGIEDPINLFGFELGNENYFQADAETYMPNEYGNMTDAQKIGFAKSQASVYTRFCENHIDAIHADFPEIDFFPNITCRYDARIYADPWAETVFRDLHGKIKGIAIHDYYGWIPGFLGQMDHMQNLYESINGEKTKFVFTEHAQWGSGDNIQRCSLEAALPEAAYFNQMLMRDDMLCANYHNIDGEHWALFQQLEGKYYVTGVNEVHRMYTEKLGDTILPIAENGSFHNWFSALATRRDNGQIAIAIMNNNDHNTKVNLNFANKQYRLVHESVLTAPNKFSRVYNENTKDIFTIQERDVAVDNVDSYTAINKSLTILTLEEMGSQPVTDPEPVIVREAAPKQVEKDLTEESPFYNGEPDDELYVEVTGEKLAPFVDSQFDTLSVDTTTMVGDGTDYVLMQGETEEERIGTSDFVLKFPYGGDPVGGPIHVTNPETGGIVITGGVDQALLNLTHRKCVLTWQPEEFHELSNNYKLTVNAAAGNSHPGFGVRFHISQDGKSFYMLAVNGPNDDAGKPVWELYKFVDGTNMGAVLQSKVTPEVSTSNYLTGDYQLEMTVLDDASVKVTVTGRNGEFNETQTFKDTSLRALIYNAKSAGYIGFVKNGAGEITLKGVKLENYIQKDESDRYNFTGGTKLRKIVNEGTEDATILVCNDDFAYKVLGVVPAGGKFINTLTDKSYQYVKVEGGKDLKFYTGLEDMGALRPTLDFPKVYARINGVDTNDVTYTSLNDTILYTKDGILVPVSCGTATLKAESGDRVMEKQVSVSGYAGFYDDFESYGNTEELKTPETYYGAEIPIAGDWVLDTAHSYVINGKPRAYIQDGKLHLSGASVDISSSYISYMEYDGGFAGVDNQYTLSFTGGKASTTSGMAIRFHAHDDGESYYQLRFGGTGDNENYVWRFDKVEKGLRIDSATVYGPTFQGYAVNGNGPLHGEFKVSITVDNGQISWTINGKRYNNRTYNVTESYTDPDFCYVAGEDMEISFRVNCPSSGIERFCTFDDVKLSAIEVPETMVKETPYGNYVLLNKEAYKDALIFRAEYETQDLNTMGMLTDIKYYSAENWASQEFISIFVPTEEFEMAPYKIWNLNTLKDLGVTLDENGLSK